MHPRRLASLLVSLLVSLLATALAIAGCGGSGPERDDRSAPASEQPEPIAPSPGGDAPGRPVAPLPGPPEPAGPEPAGPEPTGLAPPATGPEPGGGTRARPGPGSEPAGSPRAAAASPDGPAGTAPDPATSAAPVTPPGAEDGGQPGTGRTIKLGGVFPLSGPLGSVGKAMFEGIQAVLAEANRTGGIAGARLEFKVEDDQFDPARGKALVQKLISEDKVFAFAGIFSPFTTQAALPDIRAAGVPVVSPSGSDDREFAEPLLFPVTNPCGRQMAGNVQHAVERLGKRRLAVVYLNVEAVANCTAQFSAVARKLGAEVVFSGATGPAAPDCASRIVSARASGADALVIIVDNLGVVKCVQAREQQDWDVPTSISYNIVDDPTLLDGLGEAAEGLLSSSPFTGASSAEYAQVCAPVKRFYPKAKVQFFLLVGCLASNLLVDSLRAVGPAADRAALLGYLESGRVFALGGLAPDISFGPGRHLPYDLTASVEVRNGRWIRTGPLYTPVAP